MTKYNRYTINDHLKNDRQSKSVLLSDAHKKNSNEINSNDLSGSKLESFLSNFCIVKKVNNQQGIGSQGAVDSKESQQNLSSVNIQSEFNECDLELDEGYYEEEEFELGKPSEDDLLFFEQVAKERSERLHALEKKFFQNESPILDLASMQAIFRLEFNSVLKDPDDNIFISVRSYCKSLKELLVQAVRPFSKYVDYDKLIDGMVESIITTFNDTKTNDDTVQIIDENIMTNPKTGQSVTLNTFACALYIFVTQHEKVEHQNTKRKMSTGEELFQMLWQEEYKVLFQSED